MYLNFHAHSVYSKKDALSEPIDIARINKEFGNDVFCITDHGDLSCWIAAYLAAEKEGMQFIPGCEFYVLPKEPEMWLYNDKNNADVEVSDIAVKYYHLVAIAKNQQGVKSLIAIYNSHEDHYGKPCVTQEALFKNHEGVVIASACASGELYHYANNDRLDKVREVIREYKEVFDEDYYVELQYHGLTFTDEKKCYGDIIRIAKEEGVKFIPTTDSHYNRKEDAEAHSVYKDIFRTNYRYDFGKGEFDPGFDGDGYYIKDEEEIREAMSNLPLSQEDIDQAIANTVELRKRCEPTHFPKALPLTDKEDELRELVEAGFAKKRKGTDLEETSRERVEYEMDVVRDLGFTEYFINMHAILQRAKDLGMLPGPARGCFLPGNMVLTEHGVMPIEQVPQGFKVKTLNGYETVTGLLAYDIDEECIEIELSNGETIRCTPDHEIYCGGEWVEAGKLCVGDELFEPSK